MNHRSAHLGTENVKSLLLKLSIPAILGMMVNSLYNIVDTIFIGQGVGPLAIGGLAIAFPIQMITMGFAQMVGIGAASAVSRNLGAKNIERADHVTGNAYLCIFLISLVFAAFGLVFVEPLLKVFGATDTLLPYAKDYITIIFYGSVFFSFAVMSNNLIRAEGNAKTAMFTMMLGAVLNMLLDPIFIFVFDMGIKGAAWATIISQFLTFIFVLTYIYSGKSSLKVKLHHLKPEINIIQEIFAVGSSAFVRQITSTIFAIVVNNSLRIYGGDLGITIFGIINRIIMFLFMPIMGVVQGMQPIAGFNYGAKSLPRIKEVIKLSLKYSSILGIIGWIIGQLFPTVIMKAFTSDAVILSTGPNVFRIVIAAIPFLGIQFVGATLFQSLGKAIPSIILNLLRQFFLLTPLLLILPRIFNLGLLGVWISFPIADLLAVIITLAFMEKEMHKISIELEQTS